LVGALYVTGKDRSKARIFERLLSVAGISLPEHEQEDDRDQALVRFVVREAGGRRDAVVEMLADVAGLGEAAGVQQVLSDLVKAGLPGKFELTWEELLTVAQGCCLWYGRDEWGEVEPPEKAKFLVRTWSSLAFQGRNKEDVIWMSEQPWLGISNFTPSGDADFTEKVVRGRVWFELVAPSAREKVKELWEASPELQQDHDFFKFAFFHPGLVVLENREVIVEVWRAFHDHLHTAFWKGFVELGVGKFRELRALLDISPCLACDDECKAQHLCELMAMDVDKRRKVVEILTSEGDREGWWPREPGFGRWEMATILVDDALGDLA
jgi:hypothetical protein